MGAQNKHIGYNKIAIIYCKEGDEYYIYDPNNYLDKHTIDFASSLCGNDEFIKDNLTYEEAKNFLSIILKLKGIPE